MRPRRHDHASPPFYLGLGSTGAESELGGASQAQIEATDATKEPLPCYSLFLFLDPSFFFTRAQLELASLSAFPRFCKRIGSWSNSILVEILRKSDIFSKRFACTGHN